MPNARLIQQSKAGLTRIIAQTAVLSIEADRRQHSVAKHTVMRNKANAITVTLSLLLDKQL